MKFIQKFIVALKGVKMRLAWERYERDLTDIHLMREYMNAKTDWMAAKDNLRFTKRTIH